MTNDNIKPYTTKTGKTGYIMNSAYIGTDVRTGKQVRTDVRGKTKKAVKLSLERKRREFQDNGNTKSKVDTFQNIYEIWMRTYTTTVANATLEGTVMRFEKYVLPTYGSMRVDKINVLTIQSWLNDFVDNGMSDSNIKKVLGDVRHVLSSAVSLGLIKHNPAKDVIRPKGHKPEKKLKFYTREQLQKFLAYLKNRPQDNYSYNTHYTLFLLLANSGLRISEALALKWSDIRGNRIYITRTFSGQGTKRILKETKTRSGMRDFVVDGETLHALHVHHMAQNVFHASMGFKSNEFVFTGLTGKPMIPMNLYKYSADIAEKVGLPNIGLHGFRHTHATMLFEAGASAKAVQERLGHANIEMTLNTYTHVTQKTKDDTAKLFADYMRKHG
jgi:integrase